MSQRIRIERASDAGSCELLLGSSQTSFDLTGSVGCAGGTLATLALDEQEAYRARIVTRNGVLPLLENQASVESADSVWVTQDAAPTVPSLSARGAALLAGALILLAARALRGRDSLRPAGG